MEILSSLKSIYANSKSKIFFLNSDFTVAWRNQNHLPDSITLIEFTTKHGVSPQLPIYNEMVLKHCSGSAARINPYITDNCIEGYILELFNPSDIETLSCSSNWLHYKNNFLGNIRLELAEIISDLDFLKEKYSSNSDFKEFEHKARYHILRTFSASANVNEISKYFSGLIITEYLNLSTHLQETLEFAIPNFTNHNCEIIIDIEPGVFLEINYYRLEAAFLNVLINAYMYNNSDNIKIFISLYSKENEIFLSVSDNGTSADLSEISKFTKIYSQSFDYKPTECMGLATANTMATYFNGKMSLSNSPTGGLCVTFSFPASPKKVPSMFRLNKPSKLITQFDLQNCILGKGLDPID